MVRGKWKTHFVHEKAGFLGPAAAPVRTPGLKGPVLGSPLGESSRCSEKKMQLDPVSFSLELETAFDSSGRRSAGVLDKTDVLVSTISCFWQESGSVSPSLFGLLPCFLPTYTSLAILDK